MVITAGQFFLVQLDENALGDGLGGEKFLFRAPNHRTRKPGPARKVCLFLLDPGEHGLDWWCCTFPNLDPSYFFSVENGRY